MEDENVREKERIKRMISPLDSLFLYCGAVFIKSVCFIEYNKAIAENEAIALGYYSSTTVTP